MDEQLQLQPLALPLQYLVVLALALAGGGSMGTWGTWAARSPAVRAVLVGGAQAAGRALESSAEAAARTPTFWLGMLLAVGIATALATAGLVLACMGGAYAIWRQRQQQAGQRAAASEADFDDLAREIYVGGWGGAPHRTASQQLRAQPADVWRWSQQRIYRRRSP